MKNEGRIMVGEGKEGVTMSNADIKEKGGNMGQSEQAGKPKETKVNNVTPHNNMEESELLRARLEAKEKLDKALKGKKIVVGTNKDGGPIEKTVFDVMESAREAMGELVNTDKWSEKSVESFSDTKKLVEWSESEKGREFVDSLVNKDVKDDSDKKEVKDIADIILKDFWEGDIAEGREWLKSQVDKSKDIKPGDNAGVEEFVKDFELNEREQYVLKNMFLSNKIAPVPADRSSGAGGVGGAPIDVAGGEAGQAIPAPGVKGSVSESSKDNAPSKKELDDLVKKIKREVKEKKEIDWWKYGNGFLFFLILYMGAQGWAARMAEQMSERAR